jgi:hypothetical protein
MEQHADIEIVDRPWILAGMLAGFAAASIATLAMTLTDGLVLAAICAAILLAACLWGAVKALRFGRLTLHTDGTASYTVRDMWGRHHHRFPAGSLRAGVQHHRDGDGVTGRVVLLIDVAEGVRRIPFTGYFASPERAADTVARIMAWRNGTGGA